LALHRLPTGEGWSVEVYSHWTLAVIILKLAGLFPQSKAYCRYSASLESVNCSLPIQAVNAFKLVSYAPSSVWSECVKHDAGGFGLLFGDQVCDCGEFFHGAFRVIPELCY